MAKPWDDTLKKLIHANPEAFVTWFFPEARFVKERLNELENVQLEVDGLLEAIIDDELVLVNMEIQTYNDLTMAERLLRYNVIARMEHKLPVLSCVIYLLNDGEVPQSPLVWTAPGDNEVLRFHFLSIEMGKLAPEDILQTQQIGLYPLLPLTRGGAEREEVERMFKELGGTSQTELELIGFTLASLVFRQKNGADQNWLIRRFQQMHDMIRETPIYQLILQEGREEGLEEGVEKGLIEGIEKGQRDALRQAVVDVVLERFPKLVRLAKKQVIVVEDIALLRRLIVKVSIAQTAQEAKEYLLAVDEDEDED